MAQPTEQIRFCTSRDGTRIAYAVSGNGPALLWSAYWVHHLKFDWDSPVWRPWLSRLTQRHTLVRFDFRGCGLSDRERVEFSTEKLVEDLEAVVDATGLDCFAFLGMAGGTAAGVTYAVRHPDRVSHLVLYGVQSRGRLARSRSPEEDEEAETRLKVLALGWPNQNAAFGEFLTSLHTPDASPDHFRSYNDLLRLTTSPANAVGLIRAYWTIDLRDIAPRVRCPTLVLHARQDALIPFEEGRSMAALIPGARFVPLESRNHVLMDSEPAWQQFFAALDEFLPAEPEKFKPAESVVLDDLTARENQVLELLARGLDNETIGTQLGISGKTVRNQVSIIFSKLGVNSRAQAIVRARDAGFGRSAG
jgi:pimeloyl-ACP methyl ester carboxylesterase/DNA-binding CsgD family transcriptional regulator